MKLAEVGFLKTFCPITLGTKVPGNLPPPTAEPALRNVQRPRLEGLIMAKVFTFLRNVCFTGTKSEARGLMLS